MHSRRALSTLSLHSSAVSFSSCAQPGPSAIVEMSAAVLARWSIISTVGRGPIPWGRPKRTQGSSDSDE